MKKKYSNINSNNHLTMGGYFNYLVPAFQVKTLFAIVFLVITVGVNLHAQNSGNKATQSLTLEVKPITRICVAGSPSPFIINDAIPVADFTSISDENTKYSLVTNIDNMKIVASINDKMPAGTKLTIKLSSSKATSAGVVDLSDALTPVNVVTGISKGSDSDQSISYTFAANADVSELPATSRIITLTLTN